MDVKKKIDSKRGKTLSSLETEMSISDKSGESGIIDGFYKSLTGRSKPSGDGTISSESDSGDENGSLKPDEIQRNGVQRSILQGRMDKNVR